MDTFLFSDKLNQEQNERIGDLQIELMVAGYKNTMSWAIVFLVLSIIAFAIFSEGNSRTPILYFIVICATTVLVLFRTISNYKKRVRKIYLEMFDRIASKSDNWNYEFSDWGIKYWDVEKRMEFAWELFGGYFFYKGFLVIVNISKQPTYFFEIDKSDAYKTISTFVKKNLQEVKR